jgi:hypothetical protein
MVESFSCTINQAMTNMIDKLGYTLKKTGLHREAIMLYEATISAYPEKLWITKHIDFLTERVHEDVQSYKTVITRSMY